MDLNFSKKIKIICDEIMSINSFPVRVSITEIIKRGGSKAWIEKRENKLPVTNKLINDRLESLENFMIRKILWAKDFFIKNHKIPTISQLKVKAVVRNNTSKKSKVIQKLIGKSVEDIKSILSK